jgi:hypothetical protein
VTQDWKIFRRVAWLMVVVAATLATASALHLAGQVTGRSRPFDSDHAGIAEAIIGAVLAMGALGMIMRPRRARAIGIGVTVFAVAGFLLGLSMTARGGHLPDIAYHLVVLPVLVGTLVVLARQPAS